MAHEAIGPGSLVASRFRLEDLLEEHSGARFWRATDLTLSRSVAVHVVAADDPRAAAVLTAARTSATVSDQRILRVLDALEEDGLVHVVHEWGSGVSLDRLLAEDTIDPRRAAWLVREVAEAISVAHRHGIAHGRLIPENVLLTDVGAVKLIGFVVDAVLQGRPQPRGATSEPPTEHESDVRNLGALLYACLTGKWPGFPASALPEAPYDHGRACRPRQVRHGVPRQLDTLCDQILNPDPRTGQVRYESAIDICSALGEYLGDSLPPSVPVSEPTAFLNPGALRSPRTQGTLGSFDGVPSADHPELAAELASEAAGQSGRPPGPAGDVDRESPAEDPERTRPGIPRIDTDPTLDPLPGPPPPSRSGGAHAAPPRREPPAPAPPRVGPGRPGPGRSGPRASQVSFWDDPGDSGGQEPRAADARPGSLWLRLAAIVGVLAVVLLAALVGFRLGSDSPDQDGEEPAQGGGSGSTSEVIEPTAVSDFDPDGGDNPEENPDLVPLAVDGNPDTAWETKAYFEGPVLAPYRSGVGLLFDLGEETEVGEAEVTLVGGPYDLELLAAPEGASAPSSAEGMTSVAARSGASGKVTLAGAETVRTRYLVVWLTALPPFEGDFQGRIAEVVLRS